MAIKHYFVVVDPEAFVDDWVLVVHKDSVELTREGTSMVSTVIPEGQAFHRTAGLLAIPGRGSVEF